MKERFHLFKKLAPGSYPCLNRGLANLPGEKWKLVPGFEDSYMVSGLGRFKSLARTIYYKNGKCIHKKERILAQGIQKSPNYYVRDFMNQLGVVFHKEGKTKGFSARRLVYHCFVEPIDLWDYTYHIICKDGNGFNAHYKNLQKLTRTQQQSRIFERERTESCFTYLDMKELAQKGALKRMKQVTQYSLQGKKIAVYPSIQSAAKAANTKDAMISNVLRGAQLKTGKYIWRRGDGPPKINLDGYWEAGKLRAAQLHQKKVTQYTLQGERIAAYSSITEASRATGVHAPNIGRCLNGQLHSAKGFVWKPGEGRKKISAKNLMSREKFFQSLQKKVAQYTLDGAFLNSYESLTKAARAVGVHPMSISNAANGKYSQSAGFRWKFVNSAR